MSARVWTLLLLLGVLACSAVNAQSKIGFNQVLSHLNNFQAPSGGFRNAEGVETVEATSSALLLSSLYGLNAKINTVEAGKFIASLENKDAGYGKTVGAASDVESTRHALVGLARLGVKPANADNTAAYLKAQFNKDTGLFGSSVHTTALALQAFELLGQKVPADIATGVKSALKKDSFGNSASEIYYGVLASSIVGHDAGADKLAKTLVDLQSASGLFYTDASKKATSYEATADALLALHTLGSKYTDAVNIATLRAATRFVPVDIEAAADAHVALAVTKAFRDNFVVVTGSGAGAARDVIVEGSSVRPSLSLSAKESGVSHAGFQVSSTHTFSGKDATKGKLTWNAESQSYSGEPLASAGNFGPFNSVYTLSTVIPGVGPVSVEVADTKNVGYGILVNSKAVVELSGREVKENEQVTVGTDFNFNVALSSHANAKLLSGDFVATFTVLDSSNVVIHTSSVDGASNNAPINFNYKLTSADVPAGRLSFRFDVASKSKVVHTTRTVFYYLSVALVASNIAFEQKVASYKIGDTVKLTIEPATFPDLRTPHPLSASPREFLLDVKSPQGVLLRTVTGQHQAKKYAFTLPVEATFSSIGVNVLSFRYKPAVGDEIPLQNFDSSIGELYEDNNVLNYTVKADLALVDVSEKPKHTELVYGDNVVFKFRVKDAVSGKHLTGSAESNANVYLSLQNEQDKGSRVVSSVDIPAESSKEQIVASWTINANAHKGKGVLTLTVQDADGKKIPLKDSVTLKVTIGGELQFTHQSLSTSSLDTTSTAFVVEFGITCKDRPLQDAQLHASVVYTNGDKDIVLATLPVAHNNEKYSVSWSAAHRDAKSGTYKVNIYREADRLLAVEKRDQKEKEERKAKQLKGEELTGSVSGEIVVDPIHTVTIVHSAPRFTRLPVKAEFAALIIFGSIVVWLINKRSNLK